jgi:hypothetical protein
MSTIDIDGWLGAPLSDRAKTLQAMDEKNPVPTRNPDGKGVVFAYKGTYRVEAYLGMSRGDIKPEGEKCENCGKGNGAWTECVVVPGYFGGGCCNCHWKNQATYCTFRAGESTFTLTLLCSQLGANSYIIGQQPAQRTLSVGRRAHNLPALRLALGPAGPAAAPAPAPAAAPAANTAKEALMRQSRKRQDDADEYGKLVETFSKMQQEAEDEAWELLGLAESM